jgi:pimeloyl-ACP methyl ester carboxylesterase
MSTSTQPSIVLVHGAFADATGWQKVIPLLEKKGFLVTAVQNPLTSVSDDIATTGAASGSTKVKALVYVAAFAPDEGESVGGLIASYPPTALGTALVPDSAGFLYIDRAKFREIFAQDVTEGEAAIMAATQKPIFNGSFGDTFTAPAWRTIPSWYVVSAQDGAINPDLERFLAKRMTATTTVLETSHVSFISQPEKVADVIEAAAASLAK